ncbi:hypothetical protein H5410_001358 [Solanum commersonii]|uniref:Uncharacterized protein n=1 Tax=Solanum commersonii TaxID=4109 RepID=A0A9J6AYZ5_SOLCO|nr:hypothetical protein H5410_001358 [Solanum commersonii]
MGAAGTGKSRLSVDLATHFRGEIIKSEKIQYDSCFIWIDVEQSVLNRKVDMRVDEMVNADADKTKGILRCIGVPEMAKYLREEKNMDGDDELKKMILQASISSIKSKMNTFINNINKFNKKKVVFIIGAAGTGKSRLFVDLAFHFRGEIHNSDKKQVYKGLEIMTNKITHVDKQGEIEPYSNFTAVDFGLKSIVYIEFFFKTQCEPIIVGGSNSYIEKLVKDPVFMFKHKYDNCFICIDVEQSVLNCRVDTRVDEMVNADYTKGIRRSIGVPEMDKYFREEKNIDGYDESNKMILQDSISSIKRNARILICNQLDKIQRSINEKIWSVYHIIAADVSKEVRKEVVGEA